MAEFGMIIYLIRNKVNGKGYVGLTERSLEQRWKEHVHDAEVGAGQILKSAIRKYGKDAFERSIIEECSSLDALIAAEIRWIAELKTFHRTGHGYNMTLGGEGISGMKMSTETRAQMSASHRGEKNHNFGKKGWGRKGPHTEATKLKISLNRTGIFHTEETKVKIGAKISILKRKAVLQCTKEGDVLKEYFSLQEAARCVNGNANKISEVLCGRRRTHKGYIWKYASKSNEAND